MRKLDFMKLVLPGIFCLAILAQDCAPAPTPTPTVDIGGRIYELTGTLVLQNNDSDDLSITAPEHFYKYEMSQGSDYHISIKTQPSGQICRFILHNNEGTAPNSDVTNIYIRCTDSNKIIFVTAATHNGDFNGISGADAFCMADTNIPNSSNYKALLVGGTTRVACTSTDCSGGSSEHTDWVLAASTTYVRPDGTTIIGTTDSNGIFDFDLTHAFEATGNMIWTGLNADWTTSSSVCTVWDTSSGGVSGAIGLTDEASFSAISAGSQTCNNTIHLACVEQ